MFLCLSIFFLIVGAVEIFDPPISKKKLSALCLVPAFILTAFRDISIGSDTLNYARIFNRITFYKSFFEACEYERIESGYVALNYILGGMGLEYYHFQFFVALFIYVSYFYFISKYSKNVGLSCFLFLTLRLMFGPMNVVRMYLAVASLLYSLPFIQKRKFIPFFFCVLLATLFHKSALIFIILYPLAKIDLRKKIVLPAIAAAGIIAMRGKMFFLYLTSTLGLYENYLNKDQFNTEGKIAIYLMLAIDVCFALFIWYNGLNEKKNEPLKLENEKKISMSKICKASILIVLVLDIIGLCSTIMGRITGYFAFCWLIMIPMTFSLIKDKAKAFAFYLILVSCLLVQFQITMIYRPNWNCVEPYKFFFGVFF